MQFSIKSFSLISLLTQWHDRLIENFFHFAIFDQYVLRGSIRSDLQQIDSSVICSGVSIVCYLVGKCFSIAFFNADFLNDLHFFTFSSFHAHIKSKRETFIPPFRFLSQNLCSWKIGTILSFLLSLPALPVYRQYLVFRLLLFLLYPLLLLSYTSWIINSNNQL